MSLLSITRISLMKTIDCTREFKRPDESNAERIGMRRHLVLRTRMSSWSVRALLMIAVAVARAHCPWGHWAHVLWYGRLPRYWCHSSWVRLRPASAHAWRCHELGSMSQATNCLNSVAAMRVRPSGVKAAA